MMDKSKVDPEILRKSRRIVEVYDLHPFNSAQIKTKIFGLTYDNDGCCYLNQDVFYTLKNHLEYFSKQLIQDVQ